MTDPELPRTQAGRTQDAFSLCVAFGRGVTDARVLTAMEQVDRGNFVRSVCQRAYEDMPLPISCGQLISQPSVVGR